VCILCRHLAAGATALLSDAAQLRTMVAFLGALALVVYASKELTAALARHLRKVLGQPTLVREHSRNVLDPLKRLLRGGWGGNVEEV
jgi:hypothetical protein